MSGDEPVKGCRLTGIYLAAALVVVVADQISKWAILGALSPFESVEITAFLNFHLVFNKGAAFGLLANSDFDVNKLFLIANSGILILLFWVLRRMRPWRSQSAAAIWLICGGAFGNIIDRIIHGHVVDFIDVHYAGWHFNTFNIADSAISIGAVMIVMELVGLRFLFRRG